MILNCVQPWPAEVKNWRFYKDFNKCHWSGGKSLFYNNISLQNVYRFLKLFKPLSIEYIK